MPDAPPQSLALAERLLEPNGENYQTVLKGIAAKFDEAGALQVPIAPELVAAYQIVIGQLMQEKNDARVRARALDTGAKLLDYNMRRAIEIDKRARLDTGKATENVAHTGAVRFIAGIDQERL